MLGKSLASDVMNKIRCSRFIKPQNGNLFEVPVLMSGGAYEARTRDPMRDRHVF